MTEILVSWYPWVKAGHVIAVIAWMAGLFYLPRLFVYHSEEVEQGSATDRMFIRMERRLIVLIMRPAMVLSWSLGIGLALTPGVVDWGAIWPWTKAGAVLAMSWFQGWLEMRWGEFAAGRNRLSGRVYRLMNEVPTLLLLLIVTSVIVRF